MAANEHRSDEPAGPAVAQRVVLTGFMATGKSTVGRLLAARLGYELIDTDRVIEADHGAIHEIFRTHGEQHFRRLERDLAVDLAGRDRIVVATGGGMMVDPVNAAQLGKGARVFWLAAEPATIARRVAADRSVERPLLAAGDAESVIRRLLAERTEAYARFERVDTDDLAPEQVVEAILAALDGRADLP